MNINTKNYWDNRFRNGEWEKAAGNEQTAFFAKAFLPFLKINPNFDGTILDFGCGVGDAIPVYHRAFPKAKLIGIDISEVAIEKCKKSFGNIANFFPGDHITVPQVDVIISSNVIEHLDDPYTVARHLLTCCQDLYIAVPYKEFPLYPEHIHSFDKHAFDDLGNHNPSYSVYVARRWSEFGKDLWLQIYLKNVARFLLGRKLRFRKYQILFHLKPNSKANKFNG